MIKSSDWRQSPTITSKKAYTRKYAWYPKKLSNQTWVFLEYYFFIETCLYYSGKSSPFRVEKATPDLISDEDYTFQKLANTLGD